MTWLSWLQPEAAPGAAPSAPTGGGAPRGGGGWGEGMSSFGLMAVMMVVFYLVLIRPQAKKQKEHEALLAALKKGQKVRTTGGIRGEIVDLKDDEVILQIADRVKINVLRSHVSGLVQAQAEKS